MSNNSNLMRQKLEPEGRQAPQLMIGNILIEKKELTKLIKHSATQNCTLAQFMSHK